METHQKIGRDTINTPVSRGLDQAGPTLDRNRPATLDIASTRTGVFWIAASPAEFSGSAEGFNQIVNGPHCELLRKMRSNVNARCVTQFAKPMGMNDIHERLAWARRHHGAHRTATDAARAFGWPVSTYLGHENGDRISGYQKRMIIRPAAGITVSYARDEPRRRR